MVAMILGEQIGGLRRLKGAQEQSPTLSLSRYLSHETIMNMIYRYPSPLAVYVGLRFDVVGGKSQRSCGTAGAAGERSIYFVVDRTRRRRP